LLPEQANFAPELGKALQRRTSKVGSYKPNSLGLYDMHGNVWEWGDDEDRNSEGLSGRVSRGGSWSNGVGNCLAATRGFGAAKDSAPVRGLRLARVSAHSTGQIRTISEPPQGAPPSQPRQETIAPAALPARYRNNLSMEFALVPRGKFWMGGGNGSLTNAKEVEIPYDFYLGVFEVTQEEWQTVMGDNPSSFSRNGAGKDKVRDIPNEDLKRFPVENVSWNDAQVFLKALNAREKEVGWVYRLSRGAEWEYACRGGPRANKAEYGYDFYVEKPANQLLPGQANFAPEPGKGLQRTCKVGSFTPNSLGLYDMHGNVWEWGDDEDSNAEGASGRVSRGGSFSSGALGNCRAATRGFAGPKDRLAIRGLRLARVPAGLLVAVTTPPPDKPTPPQTNIPVTKPAVPVTAVADVDRKAAEWVLSIGGQVTIRPDNQPQTFAINRNLPAGHFQVLEVYLNGNYGFSSAALVNLKGLTNLKRLDLWLTNASDTGLAHLKGLTNLTHLSLSATHVTNDGLIHLKNLTNLRQLILTHTRVSDAGLVHLKDLSNLQELWLGATLLSDAGLVHLGGLTNLRFLSLGVNTQVTDAGLIHLKGLTNLKDLNLSMTQLTDAGVPMLASLGTRLDKLSVEGTHISAKGFATLRAAVPGIPLKWTEANRDLATLALSLGGKVHIRMKGQKEDRPIKDLSEIPVDYFQVTRLGLADLKHLPEDLFRKLASLTDPTFDHLEMLDLSGTPFQDRHLEWVFMFRGRWFDLSSYWPVHRDRLHEPVEGEFTHLVDLSLAGTQISDAGLAHLHDLKALKRLVLSRCQISGPGLAHLKKLPNLAELHLGSSLLTTPDLQVVSDLKKLERLNLAGSSISDEGLKHLHGLTNLQELDLRQTKVTAAAKATLQKVLPKCRIL
jgi:formylglycine-generating enzyme required for sulfatase activity/Leucine-rich repeat (LRR) protein